jgi:hypothetical protein
MADAIEERLKQIENYAVGLDVPYMADDELPWLIAQVRSFRAHCDALAPEVDTLRQRVAELEGVEEDEENTE